MEVVAATPGGSSPFHNHDVREWSRLDSLTGVLERARLETDHWTANTGTSSHKYNKVVDSRARSGADGNLQQQARRKLEVFQSQVPGGRIQVIKTQTVSSSRWSNRSPPTGDNATGSDFKNLKLTLNPLDLTSEKSKASVGRSVARRPPSRSRIRDDIQGTAATNLHRVSRLCHQVHENAVRQAFGRFESNGQRQSGDGVEIAQPQNEGHGKLVRTKSTSSEELYDTKKSLEDLEDLEQLQTWRRTSKLRRSLQYPKQKTDSQLGKPPDLPVSAGNVRKIREDLETGRRLSTALRGNNVDLEALDQILKSISTSSSVDSTFEQPERDEQVTAKKEKRNSFVTVESIQAVRDRLRRTSSPGLYKNENGDDDGVVTESQNDAMNESKVKTYIYGMNKSMSGTGSLESRSKPSAPSLNRNEDWFNRRKSYGFEQMHNQQETISSKERTRVESSTDSGICRSTEIVVVPTPTKLNEDLQSFSNVKKYAAIFEKRSDEPFPVRKRKDDMEATTITIPIGEKKPEWSENGEVKRHSIAVDEFKYLNKQNDKFKRISLANDDEDDVCQKKHSKKVEFCKTEVHFAADSGRVNIVETDEKPPPTQNFRRRRRNSSNLPVLHFGDSSYEKLLFGDPDGQPDEPYETSQNTITCGNVTVNANGTYPQEYEEQKENIENEAPRGILKNKPIKPKPYHLGDDNTSDTEKTWGVKLKPSQVEEGRLWRSTVTVRNSFSEDETPEFQRLLKQLRPTSRKFDEDDEEEHQLTDEPNGLRVLSPIVDTRRSSWSVADRIKQVEDLKWTENKGYSTKVNFGDGEATVVENRHPTWPRRDEFAKAKPKRADVVPDLKRNLLNKGLVVRIGRNDNSRHTVRSKTTTNSDTNGTTTTTKITIDLTPSPTDVEFKFPPMKSSAERFRSPSLILSTIRDERAVPQQLDVLRKLYDEVHSDSEADKEVNQILGGGCGTLEDGSSVVSGSWSKIRAFKHLSHYQKSKLGSHALVEKDNISSQPKKDHGSKFHLIDAQLADDLKHLNNDVKNLNMYENDKSSPPPTSRFVAKPTQLANEQLSSPYLVVRNRSVEQKEKNFVPLRNTSPIKEKVLRQPKKSEMAYFGVKVSPKVARKVEPRSKLGEKPDLLQFSSMKEKPKKVKNETPVYENVGDAKKKTNTFDSSILEELTKAADQILQAVNGYTDEEYHSKFSSEEDLPKREPLDTISETKSWKQKSTTQSRHVVQTNSRGKLKAASSNSSVESIPRECRKNVSVSGETRKTYMTKSAEQKQRKKVVSADTTKARRLQRASSREALLQSHGSSSEDLPANTDIRKPRLAKKTKATVLTVTAGPELKVPTKTRTDVRSKPDIRVSALPEIRHKTAVSTIRSTAEKAASREKARVKSDDVRKRTSAKKDISKGASISSNRPDRTRSTTSNRDVAHQRHTSVAQRRPVRATSETSAKH